MATEFKLPELGENIETADVVNVMVSQGETIAKDQPVLELETEKAVLELPCPLAGRVAEIHVKPGDHVKVGQPVLSIEEGEGGEAPAEEAPPVEEKPKPAVTPEAKEELREQEKQRDTTPSAGEAAPAAEAPRQQEARAAQTGPTAPPPPEQETAAERPEKGRPPAPASPAIRRLARQMGIDLHDVSGSGPAGRITEQDLHEHVKTLASGAAPAAGGGAPAAPAAPAAAGQLPDFAQWGPIDRQPISNIRRKTAEAMLTAWHTVPQVTQFDTCDITDLEQQRREYMRTKGDKAPKITVTAILLKAVVGALKEYPQFNASFDMQAGELVYKKYYHIGVAVDTDHGLLVPVIRDVDRKSVVHLAKELDEIAKRARERKLGLEEMRGSCFTITNLGGIGGTGFSPIVYWPEVAILGVARARKEQVIIDDAPEIRMMMPLCLSYDHRVIDGADGARFTRRIAAVLSDPLALFMET